jgi:3-carboxy-cis,cis-muconate cycloisomerase
MSRSNEPDQSAGATALGSRLYRDLFGTPAMRAVFDEAALVAAWLRVEAALARAEAAAGLIPAEVVPAIAAACSLERIDLAALKQGTELVGYPILPLVRQIARAAGEPAGGYVHWGATTQDIMDTATALQVAAARRLLDADLAAVIARLAELAAAHRATPLAGRTHGQQALPVTLGYKFAVLIAELRRHRARLAAAGARAELVEFAGAAGTLASVGAAGLVVQQHLAAELGLGVPPIAWHTSRDGLAEFVAVLGLIGATLAKLAHEVALLQRTEIGELEEGFVPGRGGSSTMPQKRNPITCETIIGANAHLRQLVPVMLDAMLHDGERATGPWHAEWLALPEACLLAHGIVVRARELLAGLVVRPAAMRRNLALTRGLLNAEAVMMALAPALGRQAAHDAVYAAAMRAIAADRPLREEALADPVIAAHLSPAELDRLLAPEHYLGLATAFVDRVLADGDAGEQG